MAENAAMTLTQKIIAIAVTIMIISTVALPVITDAETETKTGSNASIAAYQMTDVVSSSFNITINSDYYPVVGSYVVTTVAMKYIAIGDTFVIRHTNTAAYHDKLFVDDLSSKQSIPTTSVTFGTSSITFTDSSSVSHTITYSSCLYAAESGKYGFFCGNNTFYVNDDTMFYNCLGISATNSGLSPTHISVYGVSAGTMAGLTNYMTFTTTTTVTSMVVTGELVSSAVGNGSYYVLANQAVAYSVVTNLGTYSSSSASIGFIAPLAYEYDSANDYATLFDVVIIMLILVPIMIAVRMITLRRN